MIHNIKLYPSIKGNPDISGYEANQQINKILISNIPQIIDISFNHINIYYKSEEYSFARVYSVEKVFPSILPKGEKNEIIRKRNYRITFNNPRNQEKLYSGIIELNKKQNWIMRLYQFIKWFKREENLMWFINMLILILTTFCGFSKCCR